MPLLKKLEYVIVTWEFLQSLQKIDTKIVDEKFLTPEGVVH